MPLALPGSLPRDYRWLGPGFTNTDGHGMVVARSSTFGPDPLGGAPTVEVCTQVPDVDHCQRGASTIHRTLGNGVPVVVSFRGPEPSASELAWWRAVRLNATTTPAWLD
ncbi:hypothetical protein [Marmoricola sp. RAF53]|uniref:hypothetical protein n=1 Tax=Marmoricola sp. RAF53 TaxID=3233059 RepID=UPI003F973544